MSKSVVGGDTISSFRASCLEDVELDAGILRALLASEFNRPKNDVRIRRLRTLDLEERSGLEFVLLLEEGARPNRPGPASVHDRSCGAILYGGPATVGLVAIVLVASYASPTVTSRSPSISNFLITAKQGFSVSSYSIDRVMRNTIATARRDEMHVGGKFVYTY